MKRSFINRIMVIGIVIFSFSVAIFALNVNAANSVTAVITLLLLDDNKYLTSSHEL